MEQSTIKKEKNKMSILVMGHVDSGKSTIIGHLLKQCGSVSEKEIENYEQEAAEMGKGSFKYAWVMDKLKSERERGVTIDISAFNFETKNYTCTIIDAPGHKNFIKNMITGASQADVGILVISAIPEEFEVGYLSDGQSREHPYLAFTFGVKQLVVVINKMDSKQVNYQQSQYEEITNKALEYLKKIGYNKNVLTFVPVSGWLGENLTFLSENMNWYTGPSLLAAIDSLNPPKWQADKPLRIPIREVFKIKGVGTVAVGKVETGILSKGMILQIAPSDIYAECGSIEMNHQSLEQANPGDIVGFHLKNVDPKQIRKGFVASSSKNYPAKQCKSFQAHVIVTNHPGKISVGYTPIVHIHTASMPCKIEQIEMTVDRRTGKTIQENPVNIQTGDAAVVKFVPAKPLCLEPFAEFPKLARFTIRDFSSTVGVGVIKTVEKIDDKLKEASS